MADGLLGAKRSGRAGKPAILLLHGFLGSANDWSPVCLGLKDEQDLLAIDLPGHGASADVDHSFYTLDSCCKAISETANYSQIAQFVLVGYSMGGRIGLKFAVTYPKQVKSLVLVSTSPGIESESARLSRLASDEQFAERLVSAPLDRFVDEWYQQPLFESLRKSPKYAPVAANRADGNRDALVKALIGFSVGRQASLWDRLGELKMPVCYVAGETDSKYSEIGRRVVDLCPQGKLHIIPRAGHAVHIEQPEELSRVIASFVQLHA